MILRRPTEPWFEGRGIYGWDTAKRAYVGTWIDSMRGSLVIGAGTRSNDTMSYRFELHGDRPMRWIDETERADANTRTFRTLVEMPSGEMHPVVTATYRRRS